MDIIKWKTEYALGIEKVDNQHMRLIALINRLVDSYQEDRGRDTIETIFQGLMDYCSYHFVVEEMVMRNHSYGEYVSHKTRHDNFINKIKYFKADYSKGNSVVLVKTVDYLNDWLIDHIVIEDRKYVPSLRKKF